MGNLLKLIGGSNPYILLTLFMLGFGCGSFLIYKIEHGAVLAIELMIANQKIEASKILATETAKVSTAEQLQRTLNLELDKSRETLINTSNAYSLKQSDLINRLQFTDGRKNSGPSTDKSSNSFIYPTDAEEFTWVSKKLLRYLGGESKRAEQDGIDKNELIDFVLTQNCGIPK